jgi:hypothetical protein
MIYRYALDHGKKEDNIFADLTRKELSWATKAPTGFFDCSFRFAPSLNNFRQLNPYPQLREGSVKNGHRKVPIRRLQGALAASLWSLS